MSVGAFLFLVAAGFAAGLSGSIAGLASLFSYPALLAVGLAPNVANMTNTVALTLSSVGSAVGSRPELAGQARGIARIAPFVVLGGASGAALLLLTPPGVFELVVPVLVGGASAVLLAQPWISRVAEGRAAGSGGGGRRRSRRGRKITGVRRYAGICAIAVYGGYFGAAAGVLFLTLLLVTPQLMGGRGRRRSHRGRGVTVHVANAYKNVLLGVGNAAAALGFVAFGSVGWAAVLPTAVGLLVGGYVGPAVARRLPGPVLRVLIGLAGIGLAVVLAVDAWG